MEQLDTKIVPLSPDFLREAESLVSKSFDLAQQGSDVSSEIWSPELKAFLDALTLKSLFFSEDWVFIAVDLFAMKISAQPLQVVREMTEDNELIIEPVPEHPLNELIKQPNEWQDYSQWMYNTCVELGLMGNAIIWHAPRSGQLITMATENISINFNQKGAIDTYMVCAVRDDGAGPYLSEATHNFKPEHVVHVRRPNPSSMLWGLSPFTPGRKSVLFNRYSADYLNAFYNKQALPGLAMTIDRAVNEDVALRQLRSFEVAYQGRKNMRRSLILPKGVDVKALTHSLSDQNLIEHIDKNRETILALLKVPKHEVGLQTAGSLGSEEFKTALRNFWEATLIPNMGFIAGALTKFFQKQLGEGLRFRFDISNVEALKDDLAKLADIATKMLASGLSINEVRQQVWKKETVNDPDADKPYVLVSGRQSFGVPFDQEPAPAPETQNSLTTRSFLRPSARVDKFRDSVQKQLADEESRTIGELAKDAVSLLVDMTGTAIEVVAEADKARKKYTLKELPSDRVLRRRIEKALADNFEERWQTAIARTLSQSVELGYGQMLEMVFNEDARREVEVLRARDARKRNASLTARGLDSFAYISRTHTDRIMSVIADSVRNGEAIGVTMRRVAEALGTPGQLTGKAEAIARTETLTAVSIGQSAATKNAMEAIPGLKKAWLSAGDNRVRDSHADVNGEIVNADKKFSNGLAYPRDTDASDPAEVINCRCSLILLPPGEDLEIP